MSDTPPTSKALNEIGRFLSLVLRHTPEAIGIHLEPQGWTDVAGLMQACSEHGRPLSRELLEAVVATSAKRRFALSDDGLRVRANQGHSTAVDLAYPPAAPPEHLFHGTVHASLAAVRAEGLKKMSRHHVHLSADAATARVVARRRGAPVILRVAAGEMHRAGHVFFVSENGVWLCESVPAEYFVEVDGV